MKVWFFVYIFSFVYFSCDCIILLFIYYLLKNVDFDVKSLFKYFVRKIGI